MYKRRIGVLRGGKSHEYEISLATGNTVLENLDVERYIPVDIVVHPDGIWYVDGKIQRPEQCFAKTDVIFNALHGEYGEDGKLQRLFEMHRMPYTGSRSISSAISLQRHLSKKIFNKAGIKTPLSTLVHADEDAFLRARDIWRSLPHPMIVKPATASASIAVEVVTAYENLIEAILVARCFSTTVLVEEYIAGREATCGIIDDFRGQHIYALPPLEVVLPPGKKIYDYGSKYTMPCSQVCPGRFSGQEKHELQELAKQAHSLLSLRHYSRSDFIVSPKRGIFLLETNALPTLTKEAPLSQSLAAVGVSMPHFLDHVLSSTT